MNTKLKAALLMTTSALAFSFMQILIATTADTIPLFEQLFFRNLIASFIAYLAIRKKHLTPFGSKCNRPLLLSRSIFGFLGMITTFYASGNGNQGDVSTILKMSPFVVTILAFLFLKETITRYQIIGLVVAFLGAYFVSNPEFNSDFITILAAFFACIFSGVAYTLVSALKGRERPEVIIFFFSSFSTIMTIPVMMGNFVLPSLSDFIILLFIGCFAALGQLTLTYSYSYAKASEVSIYNYTGIIFSIIFGSIFLGQTIKSTSIIGSSLVIFAGLIVYLGNKHLENKLEK